MHLQRLASQLNLLIDPNDERQYDILARQFFNVPYIPFPVALHTVDILGMYNLAEYPSVLLGRKHGQEKWVFIGGFLDPRNTTEFAAVREFKEETSIDIDEDRLIYLGSQFIDDARYKDSVHKITTSVFCVELTKEEIYSAVGADDIEEVRLFDLEDVEEALREQHKPLLQKLLNEKHLWLKSNTL